MQQKINSRFLFYAALKPILAFLVFFIIVFWVIGLNRLDFGPIIVMMMSGVGSTPLPGIIALLIVRKKGTKKLTIRFVLTYWLIVTAIYFSVLYVALYANIFIGRVFFE